MVRLLHGPIMLTEIGQKLVFLQPSKRLQLDRAWAIHQTVELLGEPGQIARVRHGIEHQTLVPLVGAAFTLHLCSRPITLSRVKQLFAQRSMPRLSPTTATFS